LKATCATGHDLRISGHTVNAPPLIRTFLIFSVPTCKSFTYCSCQVSKWRVFRWNESERSVVAVAWFGRSVDSLVFAVAWRCTVFSRCLLSARCFGCDHDGLVRKQGVNLVHRDFMCSGGCILLVAFRLSRNLQRSRGRRDLRQRDLPNARWSMVAPLALLAGGDKPTITQFHVWPVFFAGIFLVSRASVWFLEAVNVPHRWLAVSWFGIGIFLTVASVYARHKTRSTGA
jgi:hypothetical protein